MANNSILQNAGAPFTRRDFIKTTAAATASLMASGNFAFGYAAGETIRVGLIGCGGRGTGAAKDCVESSTGIDIVALGDLFPDRVSQCKEQLRNALSEHFKVKEENCFSGFDAYKNVIASEIDLVILATPPGFRPMHLEAAIAAGKHVFMEKPVAVDPAGVRSVFASSDLAKQKGLAIVAGTQRRHQLGYLEAMKRIHSGAIGEIVAAQVYWNQGGLWMHPRQPGWTDMEWQARNWLYFTWLSGDHIVEQHIHNIDVGNWMRGDMHPSEAQGMGGRQVRTGKEYGQIFDHHFVEFTYPDGTKMYSQCRHIEGCASEVSEHAHGTKGTLDIDDGAGSLMKTAEGMWKSDAQKVDNHHQEHHDMFAALRRGEVYNEADYGAASTFTSILGRMATYSGKIVRWDEALKTGEDLSPASYDFAATPPVVPDANGFYPVPVPGKTEVMKVAVS